MKLVQETRHPEDYNSRSYYDQVYELSEGALIRIRRLIDSMGTEHIESISEVKESQKTQVVYEPVGETITYDIDLF